MPWSYNAVGLIALRIRASVCLGRQSSYTGWLRLGNNSRLWTSCWQVTTWWWPGYSIFVFLMCCVALLSVFSIKTSGSDLHPFLPLRVTLSIGTQLRLWESTCPLWQTLRAFRNPFTLSVLLHSLTHSFTRIPFFERYTSKTSDLHMIAHHKIG